MNKLTLTFFDSTDAGLLVQNEATEITNSNAQRTILVSIYIINALQISKPIAK